jgi:hypothetical protein
VIDYFNQVISPETRLFSPIDARGRVGARERIHKNQINRLERESRRRSNAETIDGCLRLRSSSTVFKSVIKYELSLLSLLQIR